MADAIQNGQLTELVPQKWVDVELGTSGAVCSAGIGKGILAKLEDEKNVSAHLEDITQKACRLMPGFPFHRFRIAVLEATDDQIDEEADRIASNFEGSLVEEGRRLAESVNEVNSAQGMDEVVVADSPSSPSSHASPCCGWSTLLASLTLSAISTLVM